MKRNSIIVIVVVAILVLAGGGYALMHKSPKQSISTTSSTNSTPAVNDAVLTTKTSSTLGQYLADPNGMALYTYGGDSAGVSNCTGSCLTEWPAYQASSTSNLPTGVGTIKRSDNGESQYTYNGMALYTFKSDSAGNITGNNVDNFTVAKPATSSSSTSTPTTSNSSTSSTSGSYNW